MMFQKSGTGWNGHCYAQNQHSSYLEKRSNHGFDLSSFSASNLRPQASNTHAEKLALGLPTFSRATLASISSISSCGKRIPFLVDLLLLLPVAMPNSVKDTDGTMPEKLKFKVLDVCAHQELSCAHTLIKFKVNITKPGSAATRAGLLTTALKGVTSWLIHSLPKLALNFSIAFWYTPTLRRQKHFVVYPLKPIQSKKHGKCCLRVLHLLSLLVFPCRRCAMFDNTPLEQEELIDQCRALAYAIVELREPQAKEILMFILAERLNALHRAQEDEAA
ncbi:putative phage-related protein [Pectobacterium atrosepticum SCRI1043]|uniref:Phage-related protein n=2 Tax=Pectobacteriaceae TaxID=1903410 RepID=Q6D3J1_PECAS|nr:putative phage-related protein [Pectobacterium atrosepticum SCRI1043]